MKTLTVIEHHTSTTTERTFNCSTIDSIEFFMVRPPLDWRCYFKLYSGQQVCAKYDFCEIDESTKKKIESFIMSDTSNGHLTVHKDDMVISI